MPGQRRDASPGPTDRLPGRVRVNRRACLVIVAGAVASRVSRAIAQSNERTFRVGVLRPGVAPVSPADPQVANLPAALRELGYVDGRNLVILPRYADGDPRRLPALADELLQAQVDVVVAVGFFAVRTMKEASSTVPIIMFGNFDPLALGFVNSLARPGRNVTGVLIAPDGTLAGKRLELLKAAVPSATRIALLVPDDDSARPQVQETQAAARALGVELPVVVARGADYKGAFAAIARQRVGALVVGSHQYFLRDRQQIIQLAAEHRLPAMYEWREQVVDGGLMTYSTNLFGLYQRIATLIDRILKGAPPGEIPVERPTTFSLVINLKTAKALGLTIPTSVLLRADQVIE
jgi:putative ABC transport system substrate-binding protein